MGKDSVTSLLEQNTINALLYVQNMEYDPDTNGYAETMEEVRKNCDVLIKLYSAEDGAVKDETAAKEKRKDRLVTIIMGAAQIVVPAAVYLVMAKSCLVYEETGAITSAIGRSIVNKIRPDSI